MIPAGAPVVQSCIKGIGDTDDHTCVGFPLSRRLIVTTTYDDA
jgi:hypothetical protein